MAKINSVLCTMAILLLLTGCAKQQQITEPAKPICAANIENSDAIKAADGALGKMGFSIDKADYEGGYLRTKPLPAGQWFEFWQKDNVGAFNTSEASIQNIRRTVEIETTKRSGMICLDCSVKTERLSLSQDPNNSQEIVQDRFSDSRTFLANEELELTSEKQQWINLGEDEPLRAEILKRIEKQLTGKK